MASFYENVADYTEQEKRFLKLMESCKSIDCFEHEGRTYKGDKVMAAKSFIKNNPQPADFSVWLQDHYRQLF